MKQHITQEQYEELTPAQCLIWQEWLMNTEQGKKYITDYEWCRLVYLEIVPPIGRSVGDLIQFLNDQFPRIAEDWLCFERPFQKWIVRTIKDNDSNYYHAKRTKHTNNELVDVLWETVKHVLKDQAGE